jgi:hypothetical protein
MVLDDIYNGAMGTAGVKFHTGNPIAPLPFNFLTQIKPDCAGLPLFSWLCKI